MEFIRVNSSVCKFFILLHVQNEREKEREKRWREETGYTRCKASQVWSNVRYESQGLVWNVARCECALGMKITSDMNIVWGVKSSWLICFCWWHHWAWSLGLLVIADVWVCMCVFTDGVVSGLVVEAPCSWAETVGSRTTDGRPLLWRNPNCSRWKRPLSLPQRVREWVVQQVACNMASLSA